MKWKGRRRSTNVIDSRVPKNSKSLVNKTPVAKRKVGGLNGLMGGLAATYSDDIRKKPKNTKESQRSLSAKKTTRVKSKRK